MILCYLSFFGFIWVNEQNNALFRKQPNTRHHQTATNKVPEAQSNQSPVQQIEQ
jgi:hypothetical protein